MDVLLLIGLAALLVGVVAVWTLEDGICAELRAKHPDVWDALGSPNRFFDDFGSARHSALEKLCRNPQLMTACSAQLLLRVRLRRRVGRLCLGCAGIALALGLAHHLGVV